MPWFRVTYERWFDEVEAEDVDEAKRLTLPSFEFDGATADALEAVEIPEPPCE